MESCWALLPPDLDDERRLAEQVLAIHRQIHARHFQGLPGVNESLGLQVRAARRIEEWQVLLLLAPWMFSRLWFPLHPPPIDIPADWSAEVRDRAGYQLLGPLCSFEVLGQRQQAHLNYHSGLGHYLLQPLALNLQAHADAESVFEAWNEVIRVRDENMAKMARDCPFQKEISRRELFRRLRGRSHTK